MISATQKQKKEKLLAELHSLRSKLTLIVQQGQKGVSSLVFDGLKHLR